MAIQQRAGNEITYWEKVATSRWGSYITEIEKRAILQAHYLAKRPTTALEIGCEGGRWSKLLSDLGWSMICTDVNQQTLDICKSRIPMAKCILVGKNDSEIPCDTETIGLLLCIEVTPVIQSEWFVHETFRVLHGKGLVVGIFLNLLSFRGLFTHLAVSLRDGYNYYRRSYPAWRRWFCKTGFNILFEEGFCWFPFRRASDSFLVPVATRIEHCLGLYRIAALSPWIVFIAQKN